MAGIDALNERFGIADVVKFEPGQGGLTRIAIVTPAAEAHVYLHGAHVTHFQPCGEKPVLFLSTQSNFADGQPIRGGVPVVFPYFGPHKTDPSLPMHGPVRLHDWDVSSVTRKGDDVELILATTPDPASLRFIATIGRTLDVALEVKNTGGARDELKFEEAMHTYFAIADIRTISIHGLKDAAYTDKVENYARKTETGDAIGFTDRMDRVYNGTKATCTIDDPGNRRTIVVEKEHSDTTVVWSPWER